MSETNTISEPYSESIAVEEQVVETSAVTVQEQRSNDSATAQDLQGAGVTQVRGEQTAAPNTNPQKAASVSQTQLSQDIDAASKTPDTLNVLPIILIGFFVIAIGAGAFLILKIVRSKNV